MNSGSGSGSGSGDGSGGCPGIGAGGSEGGAPGGHPHGLALAQRGGLLAAGRLDVRLVVRDVGPQGVGVAAHADLLELAFGVGVPGGQAEQDADDGAQAKGENDIHG